MLRMQPRVAVIGAGIVGLATARALGERGVAVRVYERGVPGAGQSGGEGRIFRHAHDDVRLVELAKESRAIWREWEEELGAELVSDDGAVALGDGALERLEVIERAGGLRAREIDAGELREALPLLAPYEGPAVLDPDGGTIRTTTAIEALSSRLGDALVADEVLSVRPRDDGAVEVRAGGETAEFEATVVCAGRGTQALARTAGLSLPVETAAHVRIGFAVAGEPPARLATLQDGSGAFPETGVYAATEPGNGRYGLGLSETTRVDTDGGLVDSRGLPALAERAVAYVAEALPGLRPEAASVRHCWVTELPWSEDAVAVWQAGGIHFVAGHNLFKLAPVLGRRLAAAASGDDLDPLLRPEARLGEPG
jgi:sarcosine oxidase